MAVGVALELSVMRIKTQTFLKLIYGDIINMQFFRYICLESGSRKGVHNNLRVKF